MQDRLLLNGYEMKGGIYRLKGVRGRRPHPDERSIAFRVFCRRSRFR